MVISLPGYAISRSAWMLIGFGVGVGLGVFVGVRLGVSVSVEEGKGVWLAVAVGPGAGVLLDTTGPVEMPAAELHAVQTIPINNDKYQ
jgi:hypothetical protein